MNIEKDNYQMAIDMLRCHLGLSEDEARTQLGLENQIQVQQRHLKSHEVIINYKSE